VNEQKKTERKKKNYGLIVFIALIIAILLAGGYIFLYKPISTEGPPSIPPTSTPATPSPGYTGQE
jgi:flagellar basal body-associated protein FliL